MIDDLGPHHGRTTSKEGPGRPRRRATSPLPLARRARELVDLVKALDAESGPRTIHRLRTTIRRVETLLAAEPEAAAGDDKLLRQLDRVRKRAGKVRDADVHVKAVRGLPRALASAGRDALAADLRKVRRKRLARLLRTIGDARDRGLVKHLRRAAAGASGAVHADELAVNRALARVLADFAALYERAEPLGASNLHAFRIASKRMRYRAESFAPHPLAAAIVAELKRAQDAIGGWHDWVTLAERARETLGDDATALHSALASRVGASLARAITVTKRAAKRLATMTAVGARKGTRTIAPPVATPEAIRVGARTPA